MSGVRILVGVAVLAAVSGCSVYIGPPMASKTRDIPRPTGYYTPAIETAALVAFSGDRNEALEDVAAKPGLTEPEQLYLLAVLERLKGFSGDTSSVLVALARNPETTPLARDEIARVAECLSLFSSDQARVSRALSGGG